MCGTALKFGLLVFAFCMMPQTYAKKSIDAICGPPPHRGIWIGPVRISPDEIPDKVVAAVKKIDPSFELGNVICATKSLVKGMIYEIQYHRGMVIATAQVYVGLDGKVVEASISGGN